MAKERHPPRRRRWLVRSAVAAASLLVGVACIELLLRAWSGPFLGAPAECHGLFEASDGAYQTVAGFEGTMTVEGKTVRVRINELGLRGEPIGVEQPGERRVLCLGDSMVFGHGVAAEAAFPALLAGRLRSRLALPVTAGNAGTPGFGTQDLERALRRHRTAFAPDLVLASIYLGNDFDDDCEVHRTVLDGYLMIGPMARLAQSSPRARLALRYRTALLVEQLLDRHAPGLALDKGRFALTPEEVEAQALLPAKPQRFAGLFMDVTEDEPFVPKVLGRCATHLARVRDGAGAARVLVAILPTWWHVAPGQWAATVARIELDPARHTEGACQRRLLEACARLGLPCVDLTPVLRAEPDPDACFLPEDKHLSVLGHERVAAALEAAAAGLLAP